MTQDCPSNESLRQFAFGASGDTDRTKFVIHLESCARCRETIAFLARNGDEQITLPSAIAQDHLDLSKLAIASQESLTITVNLDAGTQCDDQKQTIITSESNTPNQSPRSIHTRQVADENSCNTLSQTSARGDESLQHSELVEFQPYALAITDIGNGSEGSNEQTHRVKASENGSLPDPPSDVLCGKMIGRYNIINRLGRGGFGSVYLARDTELGRLVAIKIPHFDRFVSESDRSIYLSEARTLAQLDHPSIVPIFDFGVMPDGRCYVVSKYINGQDLARVLASGPLPFSRTVSILVSVADALHHVHECHLIHRDIKPGNLLVGHDDRIYVADFGLALRENFQSHASQSAGTPAYMSPEQVRGEGHRMDGRSDQFSLGCVMYEMLTGVRPFTGRKSADILEKILSHDPAPPRSINPQIPRELNRICLKLLSKLATQRYRVTSELAEELRLWLATVSNQVPLPELQQTVLHLEVPSDSSRLTTHSTVIPRGLRAFTQHDADFFLTLLPGIRDRNGLPPVLSHWKRWISPHNEASELHRVGVISGPPGSGKSSLVRAGLYPVIDKSVVRVVIDATADATERQLASEIGRHCPGHSNDNLPDLITAIRRGSCLATGRSLLIIIDQFEQWLHSHPEPQGTELVRAIRQCDGTRVQCLILVRDDFWLALSRFMDSVESPLVLHTNATMVDLFDSQHAKKVLIEFGRGYERLPQEPTAPSRDQDRFLNQVISNLTTNNKIFPVHLALFTEMVKSREWIPSTLRQIGGAVGIGAQFLTESFSVSNAPAHQRVHEVAARNILQALMPAIGTEIKAGRRPRTELLKLSGYADRPAQFDKMMEILETDLKLISASERLNDSSSDSNSQVNDQPAYQLSHDFLVPSIREWLSARMRKTYIGRLHQRIGEQANLWNQHRDTRFLPSFSDWFQARCFLRRRSLSPVESHMLGQQDFRSSIIVIGTILLFLAITFGFREHRAELQASALVEQLRTSGLPVTVALAQQLAANRRLAEPLLKQAVAESDKDSQSYFALRVAQLPWVPEAVNEVFRHVLNHSDSYDSVDYVSVAVQALRPFSGRLSQECWSILENQTSIPPTSAQKRFCAAQFLAQFDPPMSTSVNERWKQSAEFISEQLVETCMDHPRQVDALAQSVSAASDFLLPYLSKYLGIKSDETRARFAIAILSAYVKDPRLKTKYYLAASDWQKSLFLKSTDFVLSTDVLLETVRDNMNADDVELKPEDHERQKALAAAILISNPETKNQLELRALFKRLPNPTCRACLIHYLRHSGCSLAFISNNLREELGMKSESDAGIIAGLLQTMGEYDANDQELTDDVRSIVKMLYGTHPDAEVHSSAEWLLRRWGDTKTIKDLPITSSEILAGVNCRSNNWMRSPTGFDLSLVRGRNEKGIDRDFLISTKEVTIRQIRDFNPSQYYNRKFGPTEDCPANVVIWSVAHSYCDWLSKQEGLRPCYSQEGVNWKDWKPDDVHLSQTGYRLPTIAEWRYACRAGTTTNHYCGTEQELLEKYAWYEPNSRHTDPNIELTHISRPIGLLKPNQWGLFDTLGNVAEWCDDLLEASKRPICGFAVKYNYDEISSHEFESVIPNLDWDRIGFRVVRTIRLDEK